MMHQPSTQYLKTQIMTAPPEMLQLMLWDGAIRFAEQGKEAIVRKDIEGSYKSLLRAQKIIIEMTTTLRHDASPDLCGKLAALYNFMYRRLVDANLTKDPVAVDDALKVMRHQRETWAMLMDKLAKERAQAAQATVVANADAVTSADLIPAAAAPRSRSGYAGMAAMATPARRASLSVQG